MGSTVEAIREMDSIDTKVLAVCKWMSCKDTFDTQDKLVEHVLHEHISNAIPEKCQDLGIERKDQDMIGSSGMFSTNGRCRGLL